MEDQHWAQIVELDKEKEGISNQNGIETVPVSAELMDALTAVTMEIRNDYLKGAPEEAKAIIDAYLKKVGR